MKQTIFLFILGLLVASGAAQAQGWQLSANGDKADIPLTNGGWNAASLVCKGGTWVLTVKTSGDGAVSALFDIGGDKFIVPYKKRPPYVDIPLPDMVLPAMKRGRSMQISIAGRPFVYSLSGSAKAIAGLEQSCWRTIAPNQQMVRNRNLSRSEVIHNIIGRKLVWGTPDNWAATIYFPDGHFEGAMSNGFGNNGLYQLQSDGRICWKRNNILSGCFRFYRKDGGIFVRRDDRSNQGELGRVRFE